MVRGRRVRRRDGLYQRARAARATVAGPRTGKYKPQPTATKFCERGFAEFEDNRMDHGDSWYKNAYMEGGHNLGLVPSDRIVAMVVVEGAQRPSGRVLPTGRRLGQVRHRQPRDYVASPTANGGADWEGWFPHSAANTPLPTVEATYALPEKIARRISRWKWWKRQGIRKRKRRRVLCVRLWPTALAARVAVAAFCTALRRFRRRFLAAAAAAGVTAGAAAVAATAALCARLRATHWPSPRKRD